MVNYSAIPHNTNGPAQKAVIEAAVRQAVQEALGTAFPSLHSIQGKLVLNITVNIHLPA